MPKRKHVKKNKVVPCPDANTHARERIANQNHKKEVIRKKIEDLMQKRKQEMLTGDTVTKTVNTKKAENVDTSSETV
jgi:hypothetical protein